MKIPKALYAVISSRSNPHMAPLEVFTSKRTALRRTWGEKCVTYVPESEANTLRLGLRDIGVLIAEFGAKDPEYVMKRAAEIASKLDKSR